VSPALRRYQLDGRDCTAQITSLIVKKLIGKRSGGFQRLRVRSGEPRIVGERQAPLPRSLGDIRELMNMP
jgi:hypothetical protein